MGLFSNSEKKFKVGDKVRVRYREQDGYIVDIDNTLYMVALMDENGQEFIESYSEEQLEESHYF